MILHWFKILTPGLKRGATSGAMLLLSNAIHRRFASKVQHSALYVLFVALRRPCG